MINNVFNAKGDKMFYQHFSKKNDNQIITK
jgi:hypothetical protein